MRYPLLFQKSREDHLMASVPRKTPGAAPAKRGRPAGSGKDDRAPLDGKRSRDQEVVEAAVKLFSEKGYASTSVQDLADELGMLKGSLYYYIDTKETLLKRIFENSHDEVSEIAERHRSQDGPALERLRAFLEEYALWYATHLQRASLFAREWRYASDELRALMGRQRKYYDTVLRDFIVAAQEAGEIDTDLDVRLATYFVMSAVSSLPDWFNPRGPQSARHVAAEYARMSVALLVSA
jgi:AcrR family transcriptional regulator